MVASLTPVEVRVLGSLMEKELATPEYYPLTLNALMAACNQKSNRDPVMNLGEEDVTLALETLRGRGLARRSAEGVRTSRFCHSLAERYTLEPPECALLAELMLRGPQTAAELRVRASRMHPLPEADEFSTLLDGLADRDEPLIVQLPREPGKKERRYAHLFSPPPDACEQPGDVRGDAPFPRTVHDRIEALEGEMARLTDEMERLRREFEAFRSAFG